MLCTLHCSSAQRKESRFTVNFGNIAQQVENVPTQNETSDDSGLLLTKYRKEISHLNSKLARLAAIDREKAELEAEVDRLREMSGCLLDSNQVAESEARVAELERQLRLSEKQRHSIARELDEEKAGRLQVQCSEW
jgi:predicted RNase H-like nuclease (RuvC/YqgF family)